MAIESRTLDALPSLSSLQSSDVFHVRRAGIDSRISGSIILSLAGTGGGGGGTGQDLSNYVTRDETGVYATDTDVSASNVRISNLENATGNYYFSSNPSGFITSGALTPYTLKSETGVFATSSNLVATGSNLQGQITSLNSATGSYYPRTNPSGYITGNLANYATTGNLASTGSTLQTQITTLNGQTGGYYPRTNPSGYITGVNLSSYATTANLASTGNTLQTQITTLNSATGGYYPRTNPSGFITGVNLSSYVQTSQTGDFVGSQELLDASGHIVDQITAASEGGVLSINGAGGVLTLNGSGQASVTRDGSVITISVPSVDLGSYATTANLASTGSNLQGQITTLNSATGGYYPRTNPSGYITGVNLSSYATTANLASTGSTLQTQITTLNGQTGTYYPRTNPSGYLIGSWASPSAIGTSTPNTGRFTSLSGSSLSVNATPNVSIIYPGNSYTSKLTVAETTTLSAATNVRAFMADVLINPSTQNNATQVVGGDFRVATNAGTSGNVSAGVVGLFAEVGHNGTGTADYMAGMNIDAYNYNKGTITSLDGSYIEISNAGNGNIGTMNALSLFSSNYGTGRIDNLFDLYIFSPDTDYGGTVGNAYGIIIADHAGVGTGKSVNIESRGANSQNIFEGNILIGKNNYLNFGSGISSFGVAGYGLRDNSGTLEYKSSGGSWSAFGSSSFDSSSPGVIGDGTPSDARFVRVSGTDFVAGTTEYDQTLLFANGGNYEVYAKWALSLVGDEDGVTVRAPNATNDVILTVDGNSNSSQPVMVVGGSSSNNPLRVWNNGVIQFAASEKYLNFSTTSGSAGYGLRGNTGVIQFKNEGGAWVSLSDLAQSSSLGSYATTANLASTGSNLQGQITAINSATGDFVNNAKLNQTSGDLAAQITAASAGGVTSINGIGGILTISGSGQAVVTNNGQVIAVSVPAPDFSPYATNANLASTGSNLQGQITTLNGQTGSYYPRTNPSGYITGVNLSSYATTANLASTGSTLQGQITTLNSATGALNTRVGTIEGVTGSFYPRSNPSGYITGNLSNYVLTSQTGAFASDAEVAASYYTISSGSAVATRVTTLEGQTGSFYPRTNPSGYITGVNLSSYATVANLASTGSTLQSQVTTLNAATGALNTRVGTIEGVTGSFYPRSNPSGYITGNLANYVLTSQTGAFASDAEVAASYYTISSGSAVATRVTTLEGQTGSFYPRSNPSGYITGNLANYATVSNLDATGQNLQSQINSISGGGPAVTQQKSLTVFTPQSGDSTLLFYTRATTTLSRVASVIAGTGTVNWNLRYNASRAAAGSTLIASDVATNSSTTGQINSSFSSTIPANNFVWLSVSNISGTIDQFHATLDYQG